MVCEACAGGGGEHVTLWWKCGSAGGHAIYSRNAGDVVVDAARVADDVGAGACGADDTVGVDDAGGDADDADDTDNADDADDADDANDADAIDLLVMVLTMALLIALLLLLLVTILLLLVVESIAGDASGCDASDEITVDDAGNDAVVGEAGSALPRFGRVVHTSSPEAHFTD